MAYEHVIAFWDAAHKDQALHERIKALYKVEKTQRPVEMVRMGEARGFSFTIAELSELHSVLAFLRTAQGDTALQAKLDAIQRRGGEGVAGEVVEIARESGFSFSEEALAAATKIEGDTAPLDDAELGSVVGGLLRLSYWPHEDPIPFW